jgi:hypothetical protein
MNSKVETCIRTYINVCTVHSRAELEKAYELKHVSHVHSRADLDARKSYVQERDQYRHTYKCTHVLIVCAYMRAFIHVCMGVRMGVYVYVWVCTQTRLVCSVMGYVRVFMCHVRVFSPDVLCRGSTWLCAARHHSRLCCHHKGRQPQAPAVPCVCVCVRACVCVCVCVYLNVNASE